MTNHLFGEAQIGITSKKRVIIPFMYLLHLLSSQCTTCLWFKVKTNSIIIPNSARHYFVLIVIKLAIASHRKLQMDYSKICP